VPDTPAAQDPLYFTAFADRMPPAPTQLSPRARAWWQLAAGLTVGLGLWYLHWRWTASLNPQAMGFSVLVAAAETLAFLGSLLFFFNIWEEGDTERRPPPTTREEAGLEGAGDIAVDIYLTTYDEEVDLVALSVAAARQVKAPPGVTLAVHVLDDGNRPAMRQMAQAAGVGYLERTTNRGYKAGNLANALFATDGDFVVICDADTRLLPGFVENTLGYFRDPKVAWVQTPHWFYDIPQGQPCADWLAQRFGRPARHLAPIVSRLIGRDRIGADPFLSDGTMFFDVIQRRRNRHNASFCCGAGSIHRREAVFDNALMEQGRSLDQADRKTRGTCTPALLAYLDLQPFRYHVSEDIFTSLQQHAKGWRSVYHPQVEARMLSPWTMQAWAMQKLKYAGGTYDIMFRSGLIFRRGMPWQTKLHYLATFWSYLSALWMPVLFFAPIFSLVTGIAPVETYSVTFFAHLVPLLVMNELAMSLACKGHDIHAGRLLSLATLDIQWRALVQVLRGQKPHFPPTPKTLSGSEGLRHAKPSLALLALIAGAAAYGIHAWLSGAETHGASLVLVNLFWLGLNTLALARVVLAALWRPRLPCGTLITLPA
tara:strand:+ start:238 stop:2028 length:1791 start_codon:yes stop_codon:yes gene_type:complete